MVEEQLMKRRAFFSGLGALALGAPACGLLQFAKPKPGPFDVQLADLRSRGQRYGLLYYIYYDYRRDCTVVESVAWNEGSEPALACNLTFSGNFHESIRSQQLPELPKHILPIFDKFS
jgi:hypothetical protein